MERGMDQKGRQPGDPQCRELFSRGFLSDPLAKSGVGGGFVANVILSSQPLTTRLGKSGSGMVV